MSSNITRLIETTRSRLYLAKNIPAGDDVCRDALLFLGGETMYSLNRYFRKKKSKDEDRKRFLVHRWFGRSKYVSWGDYLAHKPSWGDIVHPWQFYPEKKNGYRKCYLKQPDIKLRNEYKTGFIFTDDISLPKRSQYKKGYDHAWRRGRTW